MKTTRNLKIKGRIFSLGDIQRVANLIGEQYSKAKDEGLHARAKFVIDFADETRLEIEDASLISEELVSRPSRVVRVEFYFFDYENELNITVSLRHGDDVYDNSVRIYGNDRAWVDSQFLSIKEAVETANPQINLPHRFKGFILHACALGIGSLGQIAIDFVLSAILLRHSDFMAFEPLGQDSDVRAIILSLAPLMYFLLWVWRWLLGLAWGASAVCSWLLGLWPSVEFAFGPEHHRIETIRRRRVAGIGTLIVIPVLIAIAYDLV